MLTVMDNLLYGSTKYCQKGNNLQYREYLLWDFAGKFARHRNGIFGAQTFESNQPQPV